MKETLLSVTVNLVVEKLGKAETEYPSATVRVCRVVKDEQTSYKVEADAADGTKVDENLHFHLQSY